MKCMHVISGDLWAGAEVSAHHLVIELARRDAVQVQAVVLNPGELADRLEAAGVSTVVLDEARSSLGALARALVGHAARERPEVIHSHRYKENVLSALAALRTGSFHVRTAHGKAPSSWGARLDGGLANVTGSTWIAVSEDLAGELAGPRRAVRVVANGLPERKIEPHRQILDGAFDDASPAWYVGYVGRLEPVKRPDRFLDVLAGLPAELEGRTVRGAIVGAGSLQGEMERKASGLGLHGRVRFLGHRDDGEHLVAALDLLLLTSDHEGLPMVLLEAMRSEVPVVATAVGGVGEALSGTRWLVAPDDVTGMIDAARTLLVSPELRGDWSASLGKHFRDQGSIRRAADRIVEIYREGLRA